MVGASPARRLSAESPSHLLVPATVMPVPSQVRCLVGHHDQMKLSRRDGSFTARTQVCLGRLVRLNRGDRHVEKMAHAMSASMARMAATTMTMSTKVFSCCRNGLKPTLER